MEFFSNLATGFGVALTPINLAFAFVGCLVGTLVGVLPGIGPVATVAMLLPNADDPSMRIRAGQRLEYPGEDLVFQALEPAGGGLVRAFIAEEPLDIQLASPQDVYRAGGAEFAAEITEALKRAAGLDGNAVRLNSWGTASVVYEITN